MWNMVGEEVKLFDLFDLFNKLLVRREEKLMKYHLFYCSFFLFCLLNIHYFFFSSILFQEMLDTITIKKV